MALLDTAELVLEGNSKVWLTAPEIVREAMKMNFAAVNSQSVRTLRQALSSNALKPGSRFIRREIKSSVCFALQRRCEPQTSEPQTSGPADTAAVTSSKLGRPKRHKTQNMKQPDLTQKQRQTQPQQLLETHPLQQQDDPTAMFQTYCGTPPETLLVEIDPTPPLTPTRPPSTVCLPSPWLSILGTRRTLQARAELNDSPVRKGRKRTVQESFGASPVSLVNGLIREVPVISNCSPGIGAEVVFMETCHTFSSPDFDVQCVRPISGSHQLDTGIDEDPCSAQGDRSHYAPFEVEPKPPRKRKKPMEIESVTAATVKCDLSDPSGSTLQLESSSSESDVDSDCSSNIPVRSRPSSQLLMKRPSLIKVTSSNEDPEDPEDPIGEESGKGEWKKELEEDGLGGGGSESTQASDMDQDYLDSRANLRRSREAVKRRVKKIRQMAATAKAGMVKPGKPVDARSGVSKVVDKKAGNQKRNISLLFQPQSPLVNENLKNFINMESFSGLTDAQKAKLVKLLPTVDRAGPTSIKESSLNNSFFSSALREWTDMVALGAFTAEHKAKLRAEERKKAGRPDNPWKSKFFEDTWGSKQDSDEANALVSDEDVPFYPQQTLPPHLKACLDTILRACNREDLASPPLSPTKTTKQSVKSDEESVQPSHLPSSPSKLPSSPVRTAISSPVRTSTSSPVRTSTSSPLRTSTSSPARASTASTVQTSAASAGRSLSSSTVRTSAGRSSSSSTVQTSAGRSSSSSTVRTSTSSIIRTSLSSAVRIPSSSPVRASTTPSVRTATSSPARTTAFAPVRTPASPDTPMTSSSSISASSKLKKMHKIPVKAAKLTKAATSLAAAKSSNGLAQKCSILSNKTTKTVPSQYLSHLPPRTPHKFLLEALSKASKSNKATSLENVRPPVPGVAKDLSAITHSVYLDHFSTLSVDYVPTEFCSPVKSLVVSLPLAVYKSHRTSRQIKLEHSYIKGKQSKREWKKRLNLKLSVPRSILEKANCFCSTKPLVLCSRCQCWYHSNCNTRTVCQSCSSVNR